MKKITSNQLAALLAGIFIIVILTVFTPAVCSAGSTNTAAASDLTVSFYGYPAALPILYCIRANKRRRSGLQHTLKLLPPWLNLVISSFFTNLLIGVAVVIFFGGALLVVPAAWLLRLWRKTAPARAAKRRSITVLLWGTALGANSLLLLLNVLGNSALTLNQLQVGNCINWILAGLLLPALKGKHIRQSQNQKWAWAVMTALFVGLVVLLAFFSTVDISSNQIEIG
ncbi:hypothetical protein NSS79_11625 [Paenibacillus sp. FSL L8-0436]|uniref:hypothetical protein n=1 Tax=Paenibacillus sp. FSL L8-0436 TaxID=2954686 RepID=UPI0031591BEF